MTKSGGNGKLLTANSQLSTAKQSRELAFAVGEAGANFASKFESEAATATTHRAEVKGEAFAKISSVVALQARSDKRKSESLGGKSNRVETKSKSLETYYFYAIRFFFYAFLTFF